MVSVNLYISVCKCASKILILHKYTFLMSVMNVVGIKCFSTDSCCVQSLMHFDVDKIIAYR